MSRTFAPGSKHAGMSGSVAASPTTEEYVRGTMAEQMALRFLRGELPLTNNVLVGLHQQLIVPSLIGRIVEASRKGAGLAKQVKTQGRSLRQIVEDSDFEWNPPSEARVEREENEATDWVEPEKGQAERGARHDGDARHGIGEGDEVFRDSAGATNVRHRDLRVAAFPATPEGVVEAALYELHRGEKRSLLEVELDETSAGRFRAGPDAAREGRVQVQASDGHSKWIGSNDDPPGVRQVGSVQRRGAREPRGPIGAYQEAGGDNFREKEGEQDPWCGAFAGYVYSRCGINVHKGFSSAQKVPKQLSSMPDSNGYLRPDTGSATTGERQRGGSKKHPPYFADRHLSHFEGPPSPNAGERQSKRPPAHEGEAEKRPFIDIRPGDVAWGMHDRSQGHVMLVVGVVHKKDGVDVVTIEGNKGNELRQVLHRIVVEGGLISGDIVGWGRPRELETENRTEDSLDPAVLDATRNPNKDSEDDR